MWDEMEHAHTKAHDYAWRDMNEWNIRTHNANCAFFLDEKYHGYWFFSTKSTLQFSHVSIIWQKVSLARMKALNEKFILCQHCQFSKVEILSNVFENNSEFFNIYPCFGSMMRDLHVHHVNHFHFYFHTDIVCFHLIATWTWNFVND